MSRDMELAALYLSAATLKLSSAMDEAGSDTEAWEQIASELRDLARGADDFIRVLKSTPPEPLNLAEMGVYGG